MTQIPNNEFLDDPSDVAARMSTGGDEWEPDDAIARAAVNAAYADRSGCPTTDELVDYTDGELDDIHSQELAAHEERCVVCRNEIRALRRMNAEWEKFDV